MIIWHEPQVPRCVAQMIPIDRHGNVLVMHRTDKVRSAKNVWSFPSGLHEIGECVEEAMKRELEEEYGLDILRTRLLGLYENIAGDDQFSSQYHWLIVVYGVLVDNIGNAQNKEPDKHDQMKGVEYYKLGKEFFYKDHPFHATFDKWAREHMFDIVAKLRDLYTHV